MSMKYKNTALGERMRAAGDRFKAMGKSGDQKKEALAMAEEHDIKAQDNWILGHEIDLENKLRRKERERDRLQQRLEEVRAKPSYQITSEIKEVYRPGITPKNSISIDSSAAAAAGGDADQQQQQQQQQQEQQMERKLNQGGNGNATSPSDSQASTTVAMAEEEKTVVRNNAN